MLKWLHKEIWILKDLIVLIVYETAKGFTHILYHHVAALTFV